MADDSLLNSRDVATLLWLAVAAVIVMVLTRAQVAGLLRLALWSRLTFIWVAYTASLTGAALGLRRLGLDYPGAAKDAVVWGVFVGLPILSNFGRFGRDPGLLQRTLRGAVAGTAFVEFFVNLYVFPLPVELLLLPLIVVLSVIAESGGGRMHPNARKVGQSGLTLVGCMLLGYVGWRIASDPGGLHLSDSAQKLLQPVLLTLAVAGLTFVVAVYAAYENLCIHVRIAEPRQARVPFLAMLGLASVLHVRLSRVYGFAGQLPRRLKRAATFRTSRRLALAYRNGQIGPADPMPDASC